MMDNDYLREMLNPDENAEKGKLYLPYTESAFGYENFIANKKAKIGENTHVRKDVFQSKADLSLVNIYFYSRNLKINLFYLKFLYNF
jgi:hypothetical protein